MNILMYLILGVIVGVIIIAIIHNPMDDSGDEFNPNIFPFEIKDPNDWGKTKNEIKKSKENVDTKKYK